MSSLKESSANLFFKKHGFVIALGVITLISVLTRAAGSLTHDVSWLLYSTNEWLHGAKLYVDIIEINPPLIFFIYAIPTYFANLTGLNYIPVFFIFTYLSLIAILLYSYRLLTTLFHFNTKLSQTLIITLYFCLALLVGNDFGQREHFLVIFSLPYMFLIALRLADEDISFSHAMLVGLVAFFAFALKPYFLAIPIAMEILILWQYKNIVKVFRPETLVLGGLMVIYLLIIITLTPEYISHIYKIAKEIYSAGYNTPLLKILYHHFLFIIVTALIFFWIFKDERKKTPLILVFTASLIAFWLSFLIQQKGWYYHIYPAVVMIFMITAFLFHSDHIVQKFKSYSQNTLDKNGKTTLYICFLCSIILFRIGGEQIITGPFRPYLISDQVATYKPAYKAKTGQDLESVYVMGFRVSEGFPMVTDNKVTWASRFPSLWILRGVLKQKDALGLPLQSDKPSKTDWIERYNMKAVTTDLAKFKPDLIIVETNRFRKNLKGRYKFSLLDYFKRDTRFQKIWSHYRLDKSTKFYSYFTRTTS